MSLAQLETKLKDQLAIVDTRQLLAYLEAKLEQLKDALIDLQGESLTKTQGRASEIRDFIKLVKKSRE